MCTSCIVVKFGRAMSACCRCSIRAFIGIGVGAGANILSRFAVCSPQLFDGLFEERLMNG